MRAKEGTPSLRSEQPDLSQLPYREDFRHDQNEKRLPYICVLPELSTGDGYIQCDMKMNPPRQDRICLSYMWGSEEDQKTVLIDGRLFRVRDNLWRFLNRARLTGITRPIWIDAICIDQTNVYMRNHWVQQMGRIFREAAEVLVWLGDGDKDLEFVVGVIDDIVLSPRFPLVPESHVRVRKFCEWVTRLANLPYWSRLWIKQEVLLGQKVCYLYGEADSYHLCDIICSCEIVDQWCHYYWNRVNVGHRPCARLLELRTERPAKIQSSRPLEDLIKRFGGSACMDVRDRVYGLLGMTEGCTLTVEYMISPTELFVRTLVATIPLSDAIKTKDLIEYFSTLVNGLKLSEDDLRRDEIDNLLRRYEGTYSQRRSDHTKAVRGKGTIGLRLTPSVIFAQLDGQDANGSRCMNEILTPKNVSERLELIPPGSHLSRNRRLDTRDIAEVWPNSMNVDEVTFASK